MGVCHILQNWVEKFLCIIKPHRIPQPNSLEAVLRSNALAGAEGRWSKDRCENTQTLNDCRIIDVIPSTVVPHGIARAKKSE